RPHSALPDGQVVQACPVERFCCTNTTRSEGVPRAQNLMPSNVEASYGSPCRRSSRLSPAPQSVTPEPLTCRAWLLPLAPPPSGNGGSLRECWASAVPSRTTCQEPSRPSSSSAWLLPSSRSSMRAGVPLAPLGVQSGLGVDGPGVSRGG